jgi:hypothetical protein
MTCLYIAHHCWNIIDCLTCENLPKKGVCIKYSAFPSTHTYNPCAYAKTSAAAAAAAAAAV